MRGGFTLVALLFFAGCIQIERTPSFTEELASSPSESSTTPAPGATGVSAPTTGLTGTPTSPTSTPAWTSGTAGPAPTRQPADHNITEVFVNWTAPDGSHPLEVPAWTNMTLQVEFRVLRAGNVSLVVRGDTPGAFDVNLATLGTAGFQPGRHAFLANFTTTPDIVRGFIPTLTMDGNSSWTPEDYPPRLRSTNPSGTGNLTSVEWMVNGVAVNETLPGTNVTARVRIRAENGDFRDEVRITIRRDIANAPDTDHRAPHVERTGWANATERVFDVSFVSGTENVRGYYVLAQSQGRWWCNPVATLISLGFCDEELKLSHQQEGYPPRLRKV